MSRHVTIKICGLTDEESVETAAEAGADLVGFVFCPGSPRTITPERAAALIAGLSPEIRDELRIVGLFVDPSDADLDAVYRHVRLDVIQLHGSETPDRVEAVRMEYGSEVIKAVGVSGASDLVAATAYDGVADWILFDARPPVGAVCPGGNGHAFPWGLMREWRGVTPWLLAGGLTPGNVAVAMAASGAMGVDVSSGVERAPGVKDPARIARFIVSALDAGEGQGSL